MKEIIYPPEVMWLKKNKAMLSVSLLEQQLGMTPKTLYNFFRGFYGLNERWWEPVIDWVRSFVAISAQIDAVQPDSAAVALKKEPAKESVPKKPAAKIALKSVKPPVTNAFLEGRRERKLK